MSRTDAHMPHWVTCTWYLPDHHGTCPHNTEGWQRRTIPDQPCDLPDIPVRRAPKLVRRVRRGVFPPGETRCTWGPDWTGVSPWPRPPRWYVEHVWHNPERTRLRGELARARAEWNGSGGTDVDPEPRQARHGAAWLWA